MPPMNDLDDIPFASEFIHEHLDEHDYFLLLPHILQYRFLQEEDALSDVISVSIHRQCMDIYLEQEVQRM